MDKKALIIFAKNPTLGKVKTRLAQILGDEKALDIYNQALEVVYAYTKNLQFSKLVYWDGGIPTINCFAGIGYHNKSQSEGHLGERMSMVFSTELRFYSRICIIGTDCVELTENILENAFKSLNEKDLVIGPAHDGGYYLLGMKQMYDHLFKNISWSTDSVYAETITRASELGLKIGVLPTLSDIDTVEDYLKMKAKNLIL